MAETLNFTITEKNVWQKAIDVPGTYTISSGSEIEYALNPSDTPPDPKISGHFEPRLCVTISFGEALYARSFRKDVTVVYTDFTGAI